jgi:hypothetical protein
LPEAQGALVITRDEAYERLAVDRAHAGLLRQLAEGWDRRQLLRVRNATTPEMLVRADCASYVERTVQGNLARELSEKHAGIVVGRTVRWYASHTAALADLDNAPIPRALAFPDHLALRRWALSVEPFGHLAVCEAEAVVIPELPELPYLVSNSDGTYEQRPGVG